MRSLASMLTSFRMPERTPEEWAAVEAEIEREEQENARREAVLRIMDSGIPPEFRGARDMLTEVGEWAGSPTAGLLFQGKSGRGKTYQACAALREMAKRGTVRFTTFSNVKHDCKDCFDGREREESVIARYVMPYCLLLDDVGKEQATAWSMPILFEIVKRRGESLKPTIVTTNHTGKELLSKFTVDGDSTTANALLSRFSAYRIVKMNGEDMRKLR